MDQIINKTFFQDKFEFEDKDGDVSVILSYINTPIYKNHWLYVVLKSVHSYLALIIKIEF